MRDLMKSAIEDSDVIIASLHAKPALYATLSEDPSEAAQKIGDIIASRKFPVPSRRLNSRPPSPSTPRSRCSRSA